MSVPNPPEDVIDQIEEALRGGPTVPRSTRGSELSKLLRSFKQFLDRENGEDPQQALDKAFTDTAKALSVLLAVLGNAINLFGCMLAYQITDGKVGINKHPNAKIVLVGMSLAFLPFASLAAGAAHALESRRELINWVASFLLMVWAYISVMVTLFCVYFLADKNDIYRGTLITLLVALACAITGIAKFRRPNPMDVDWSAVKNKVKCWT